MSFRRARVLAPTEKSEAQRGGPIGVLTLLGLGSLASLGACGDTTGNAKQLGTTDGAANTSSASSNEATTSGSGGSAGNDGSSSGSGGSAAGSSDAGSTGGDASSSSAGGGGGLGVDLDPAVEAYYHDVVDTFCASRDTCAVLSVPLEVGASDADCVEFFSAFYRAEAELTSGWVKAGTVTFDASRASACLEQAALDPCPVFQWNANCQDVWVGSVEEAGDCVFSSECAPGLYCDRSSSECPRKCVPVKPSGGPCFEDDECAEGLSCNGDDTCALPGAEGDACQRPEDCERVLDCDFDSATCVARRPYYGAALDEPCVGEYDCEHGLYCSAVSGSICRPVVEEGAACGPAVSDAPCADHLWCNIPEPPVFVEPPGPPPEPGVCEPRFPTGSECSLPDQCLGGFCLEGICGSYQPPGGACLSDGVCWGTSCAYGTCVTVLPCQ